MLLKLLFKNFVLLIIIYFDDTENIYASIVMFVIFVNRELFKTKTDARFKEKIYSRFILLSLTIKFSFYKIIKDILVKIN